MFHAAERGMTGGLKNDQKQATFIQTLVEPEGNLGERLSQVKGKQAELTIG
jgi:hypothetical protein